jgi:hypothetical protein
MTYPYPACRSEGIEKRVSHDRTGTRNHPTHLATNQRVNTSFYSDDAFFYLNLSSELDKLTFSETVTKDIRTRTYHELLDR